MMAWLSDGLFIVVWLVGMVCTFVPVVPATLLIWAGALVHALLTGFVPLTWGYLFGLGILAAFAMLIDNVAAAWGAKKFGGSSYAGWGALLGGLVGLLFGPLGLLLAPFVGAVLFELVLAKKPFANAFKSGIGTLLGILGGVGAKFLIHLFIGVLVLVQII